MLPGQFVVVVFVSTPQTGAPRERIGVAPALFLPATGPPSAPPVRISQIPEFNVRMSIWLLLSVSAVGSVSCGLFVRADDKSAMHRRVISTNVAPNALVVVFEVKRSTATTLSTRQPNEVLSAAPVCLYAVDHAEMMS